MITLLQLLLRFFTQSSRVGRACKGHKKPATLSFCPLFFGHRAACGFASGQNYAADKVAESSPIPGPLHLTRPGPLGKIQLKTYFIQHTACCICCMLYGACYILSTVLWLLCSDMHSVIPLGAVGSACYGALDIKLHGANEHCAPDLGPMYALTMWTFKQCASRIPHRAMWPARSPVPVPCL